MGRTAILQKIEASGLAGGVKTYCAGIMRGNLSSSLKDALKVDAAKVITNIDLSLAEGGEILGCSKEDVLFATGFNKNNRAPERFESALAEIRAASFLHREGFSGLKLIGQSSKKTADISGVKAGRKYAFEVCCIQKKGDLSSAGGADLDRLAAKYDEKVMQVNSSRKECGCEGGGVVFVINPYNFLTFTDDADLKTFARRLYAGKSRSRSVHVCLISGDSSAVFPEW